MNDEEEKMKEQVLFLLSSAFHGLYRRYSAEMI